MLQFLLKDALLPLIRVLAFFFVLLIALPSPFFAQSDPLPSGTEINNQNWRTYRQYMSEGLIALFEGSRFWRMPPDVRIEVGPAISIPLPKKYLQDTRQFSQKVKLVKTTAGGYVPSGYVAGLPFPHPLDGEPTLRGQRIFWDAYYRYQPRVQSAPGFTYTLDRFGNMTETSEVRTVYSQLAHLSDPGYPVTISENDPYYFSRFEEQVAPEQGKYSALLDLTPKDPAAFDELYEYVPTLRRSLRLSEAARCAPIFGSDYLVDDNNGGLPGLPQLFQIDYLGEKRILTLEHATPASFESFEASNPQTALDPQYFYDGGRGIIPFPRPAMGKWEMRRVYVISLKRLPAFSRDYCYSRRIIYVDTENYFGEGELDLYGKDETLLKTQLSFFFPAEIPGTDGDAAELLAGPNMGLLVNFQSRHVTLSPYLRSCVNAQCERYGYLDTTRYASPEGLMKIVQ